MNVMRVVIYNGDSWETNETLVNSKEELIALLEAMPEHYDVIKIEKVQGYLSYPEMLSTVRQSRPSSIMAEDGEKYNLIF